MGVFFYPGSRYSVGVVAVAVLVLMFGSIRPINAITCYNTCLTGCDTEGETCFQRCGAANVGSKKRRLPGYISQECADDNDSCLLIEAFTERGDSTFFLTTPAGCLFEYKHLNFQIEGLLLQGPKNLFSCKNSYCNKPASGVNCPAGVVDNFTLTGHGGDPTTTPCAVVTGNGGAAVIFEDAVRFKSAVEIADSSQLCINDAAALDFFQVDNSSKCFKAFGSAAPPSCSANKEPLLIDYVTCAECAASPNCVVGLATPQPETKSPTKSPTSKQSPQNDQPSNANLPPALYAVIGIVLFAILVVVIFFVARTERLTHVLKNLDKGVAEGQVVMGPKPITRGSRGSRASDNQQNNYPQNAATNQVIVAAEVVLDADPETRLPIPPATQNVSGANSDGEYGDVLDGFKAHVA